MLKHKSPPNADKRGRESKNPKILRMSFMNALFLRPTSFILPPKTSSQDFSFLLSPPQHSEEIIIIIIIIIIIVIIIILLSTQKRSPPSSSTLDREASTHKMLCFGHSAKTYFFFQILIIIHDVPKISGKTGHVAPIVIVTQPVNFKIQMIIKTKTNLNKRFRNIRENMPCRHVAQIISYSTC